MRTSRFGRYTLSIGAAALFTGCGGSSNVLPLGTPGAMRAAPANAGRAPSAYQVLHRFDDHRVGGRYPAARLIEVNGTLYGTTSAGGTYGAGTVYSISTNGVKKTLYSFRGGIDDGASPTAGGLVDVNGTLYGTTFNGGVRNTHCWYSGDRAGCGTVFAVTPAGEETVIYYFKGYPDAENPTSGLIEVNGLLYGTTMGAVYSVSTSGTETVLDGFGGGGDGMFPEGGLIDVHGTLYGTTSQGGTNADGVVYSITTSGTEKVLYSFEGGTDGWFPESGLIDVNGKLYGTTTYGGISGCFGNLGCGTVYSITTKGKEQIIYRFGNAGGDGSNPVGALTELNGTLYGTTAEGGSSNCLRGGCGTLYSLSLSGTEQSLHSFAGGTDGANPIAKLLSVNGTLYGTTQRFPGTVFALTP